MSDVSDNHSVCSFDSFSEIDVSAESAFETQVLEELPAESAFESQILKELKEIREMNEAKPSDLQIAHDALVTKFANLSTEHQELKSDAQRTIATFKAQLKDVLAMSRASDEKREAVEAQLAKITGVNEILDYNNRGLTQEMKLITIEYNRLTKALGQKTELEKNDLPSKVRGFVNKLSPETATRVTEDFLSCTATATKEQMKTVLGIIFEKVVEQPKYGSLYARLCKDQVDYECKLEKNNFQGHLSSILGNMFKTRLPASNEKLRQRKFAVFQFVGYLYLNGLASTEIMSQCIYELLTDIDVEYQESARCGIQILDCVGEVLDNSSFDSEYLFDKLKERMRSVREEIRDLAVKLLQRRANGWIDEEASKKNPMVTVITIRDPVEDEVQAKENAKKFTELRLAFQQKLIEADRVEALQTLRDANIAIGAEISDEDIEHLDLTTLVNTVLIELEKQKAEKELLYDEFQSYKSATESRLDKEARQQIRMVAEKESLDTKINELEAELKTIQNVCYPSTMDLLKADYVAGKKTQDPRYEEEKEYDLNIMVRELLYQKEQILSHKSMEDWKFNTMKRAYQVEKEKRMALEGKVAPVTEEVPKIDEEHVEMERAIDVGEEVDDMIQKQIEELKQAGNDCKIQKYFKEHPELLEAKKAICREVYDDMNFYRDSHEIETFEEELRLQEIQKANLQKAFAEMKSDAEIEAEVAKIQKEHAEKVNELRSRHAEKCEKEEAYTESKTFFRQQKSNFMDKMYALQLKDLALKELRKAEKSEGMKVFTKECALLKEPTEIRRVEWPMNTVKPRQKKTEKQQEKTVWQLIPQTEAKKQEKTNE